MEFTFQAPILIFGQEFDEEKNEKLKEAIGWLNTMLEGKAFVAGENMTIADISIIITFSSLQVLK